MIDKTREIALKILYKIDKEKAYSNIALDELINENRKILDERDIGLISEIVYGTTTWRLTLDEIIKKYSNIKLKKISPWIINILRMGIYQIVFLDKIPKSAAVNESVNLAKRYGHKSSSNFVNAILRKVEYKDYEEFFKIKNDVERISKTRSMPIWIIEELLKDNNIEQVDEICKNSNLKPQLCIRINKLKTTKEKLKEMLKKDNIEVEDGLIEDFLILKKVRNIEKVQAFQKGFFTVQDEAAGLIPRILNPKQGEKILDACSSPGGKTTYMAEIINDNGEILAFDIHEHRVELVKKVAQRLEISSIKTKVQDSTIFEEEYVKCFDKILLDVPCLGIGVLKRKPDIKWQRDKDSIKEITDLQYKILEVNSKYLKIGGELVYSTCSIFKEENEDIINKFLKNNENFEIVKIKKIEEKYFEKFIKKEKYIQVYQNEKTDGFFICKLRKTQ